MDTRNTANINITEETTVEHFAEVSVNGQSKGKRKINGGPSLLGFCQALAAEHGITSFNITLNGTAVTKEAEAKQPVVPGSSVGVSARDARASRKQDKTEPQEPQSETPQTETMPAVEMAAEADGNVAEASASDPGDEQPQASTEATTTEAVAEPATT